MRWEPVLAPAPSGAGIARADKLTDKAASHALLTRLLAVNVLKILAVTPAENGRLRCDRDSTGCAHLLEQGAKQAVQRYIQRIGTARASEDPMRDFLRGKIDGKFMGHLAAAWLLGESLLSWLNPDYKVCFTSNKVYARMAFWRTLVNEGDRRVLCLHNRKAIEMSPQLRAMASGANEEQMEEFAAKRQRRRGPGGAGLPQTPEQVSAFVLQKIVSTAGLGPGGEADVVDPATVLTVFGSLSTALKRECASHGAVRDRLELLSAEHRLVLQFGVRYHNEPERAPLWADVDPASTGGQHVPLRRPCGRHGGPLSCPLVRLRPVGDPIRDAFATGQAAIWVMDP